ncbi:MAG: hypothetical protein HC923_10845 [Myxococcales bacterium]|nr:hypothetical protein [Myxococcales bacterium]
MQLLPFTSFSASSGFAGGCVWLGAVGSAYFGAASLAALWIFSSEPARERFSALYVFGMLGGVLLVYGFVGYLTFRHYWESRGDELLRAQLLLGAFLLGVGGAVTDLASMAGLGVPRLSSYGILISALLLALLAFRSRLVVQPVSVWISVFAFAMLGVGGSSSPSPSRRARSQSSW